MEAAAASSGNNEKEVLVGNTDWPESDEFQVRMFAMLSRDVTLFKGHVRFCAQKHPCPLTRTPEVSNVICGIVE